MHFTRADARERWAFSHLGSRTQMQTQDTLSSVLEWTGGLADVGNTIFHAQDALVVAPSPTVSSCRCCPLVADRATVLLPVSPQNRIGPLVASLTRELHILNPCLRASSERNAHLRLSFSIPEAHTRVSRGPRRATNCTSEEVNCTFRQSCKAGFNGLPSQPPADRLVLGLYLGFGGPKNRYTSPPVVFAAVSREEHRQLLSNYESRPSSATLIDCTCYKLSLVHARVPHSPWRPIDEDGSSNHIFRGEEAPNVTVQTVIAVVPQDQDATRGDDHRTKLVFSVLGRERLVLEVSIDVDLALLHFHLIALSMKTYRVRRGSNENRHNNERTKRGQGR